MKRLFLLLTCSIAAALPGFAEAEYPKQGPDIYDREADGFTQISAALEKAKATNKRVLVMFGANWCVWCHRLHATFENHETIAAFLRDHYVVVLVDVNSRKGVKRNAAVNEKYGNPIRHGLPVLVILDAADQVLVTQETGALEDGDKAHDPAKVLAFLKTWATKR